MEGVLLALALEDLAALVAVVTAVPFPMVVMLLSMVVAVVEDIRVVMAVLEL